MESGSDRPSTGRADMFSGAGLGLLLGTLLGLAVTPVVAGVVGAITALLAVFLGLDGRETTLRLPAVNALRIGAFGFATVAGLVLGLYLRVNNPLAADPGAAMARWTAAFPDNPTLARQMMVFERTALRPTEIAYGNEGSPAQSTQLEETLASAKQMVLFSDLSDYDACSRLDPDRFGSPEDTLAAYDRGDPPELVQAVATRLGAVSEADKPTALRLAHDILCDVQASDVE